MGSPDTRSRAEPPGLLMRSVYPPAHDE